MTKDQKQRQKDIAKAFRELAQKFDITSDARFAAHYIADAFEAPSPKAQ